MKLDLKFTGRKLLNGLDDKCKLTVYRIIQEQVNNIIKYSRAKQVNILLGSTASGIKIKIEDDGVGFDSSKKSKGIGFRNIESRINLYGGNMEISSSAGNGCTLEVWIPLLQPTTANGS